MVQGSGGGVREESVQRAKAVFNTIKGWLVSMNAASPQSGPGVPESTMIEFLDTQWKPPLTAAEKKWILGSWPGRIQSGPGPLLFYSDLLADSPQARPRFSPTAASSQGSSPSDTRRGGASFLPAGGDRGDMQSPVFFHNASAIPPAPDISLNGIHTPPMHHKTQQPGAHNHPRGSPPSGGEWEGIDLPPPPASTPPTWGEPQEASNTASGQMVARAKGIQMAGEGGPRGGSLGGTPPVQHEAEERMAAFTAEANSMRNTLEGEAASLRHKLQAVSRERDELSQENRRLRSEMNQLKDAARTNAYISGGSKGGEEDVATRDKWKVNIRVEEAQNLPDATSAWNNGQNWQQLKSEGSQVFFSFSTTSVDGSPSDSNLCTRLVRYVDRPQWRQPLSFLINITKHRDLTGRLIMVDPAGQNEVVIGTARMPSSDLVTMGSNSAWFTLIDDNGDPMRNHAGENCSVYLKIDVAEREVDRLRVLLTQATAELDHVRANIGNDVREQLRQLRSQNKLLHATVGDLEDELLQAKDALMMNGKKGEERLVTQVQLLHRELRMAWLHQERLQNAPTVSAVDLDDRLRSEMAKIARQESERREGAWNMTAVTDPFASALTGMAENLFGVASVQNSVQQRQIDPSAGQHGRANVSVSSGQVPVHANTSVNGSQALVSLNAGVSGLGDRSLAAGFNGMMLKICVVEAKGLALDENTRCNPHAAIVMGKVKKSTRVETNTTRPHWGDETFSFEIPAGQTEGPGRYVTITVFNKGAYSKDECIGMVGLSVKRVRDAAGRALDQWFPLSLSKGDKREAANPSIRLQARIVEPGGR